MLKQFEIDGCYDSYIHDNKNSDYSINLSVLRENSRHKKYHNVYIFQVSQTNKKTLNKLLFY